MSRPVVIGLAGGIACGKSTIARMFGELGAIVLDADQVGHDVLRQASVMEKIRNTWGEAPFREGHVDRRLMANIVFDAENGPEQLAKLEAITHPEIGFLMREALASSQAARATAVILDAPVLFKAGWDALCDKLVFIETDEPIRIERALKRGWTEAEFRQREQRQTPLAEKRERCGFLISNSADLMDVFDQVKSLWKRWELPLPESTTPHS